MDIEALTTAPKTTLQRRSVLTVHGSLGSVVPDRREGQWGSEPYAVVEPLEAVLSQLLSISPDDTSLLGDHQLSEASVLVVPQGTDASRLPSTDATVVRYDPTMGLRRAVDNVIEERSGWRVDLQGDSFSVGEVANIGGVDVNDARFFDSLLQAYPDISYGSSLESVVGEAFRFGLLDQLVAEVVGEYVSSGEDSGFSSQVLELIRSLIRHNIAKINTFLDGPHHLPSTAVAAYRSKQPRVDCLFKVIDADLALRRAQNRQLYVAGQDAWRNLMQSATDSDELDRAVSLYSVDIVDELEISKPLRLQELVAVVDYMQYFPLSEFRAFVHDNGKLFENVDLNGLYAGYSVSRWAIEGTAHDPELETVLEKALGEISAAGDRSDLIFNALEAYLSVDSNRLEIALDILRQPYVQQCLAGAGIVFPKGYPQSLEDVLRVHPETAEFFRQAADAPDAYTQRAHVLLECIGLATTTKGPKKEDLVSFRRARHAVAAGRFDQEALTAHLAALWRPMNSGRDPKAMKPGMLASPYEIMRRNTPAPYDFWVKLGLGAAYLQRFPQDDLFWGSRLSLLEIYKLLREEQSLE